MKQFIDQLLLELADRNIAVPDQIIEVVVQFVDNYPRVLVHLRTTSKPIGLRIVNEMKKNHLIHHHSGFMLFAPPDSLVEQTVEYSYAVIRRSATKFLIPVVSGHTTEKITILNL